MHKYLYGLVAFVLAFAILSVSLLRSASVSPAYGYTAPSPTSLAVPTSTPTINYFLPYQGRILPDNWLWYFKAVRDRFQYMITTDPLKKAELALLFSDKRLLSSKILFESKKPDIAVSTLTKGEKYLEIAAHQEEIARIRGENTSAFVIKLASASLKHRQIIEEEILPLAPEDAKPEIIKVEYYAKNTYKTSRETLNSLGLSSPKSPFNGE